MTCDPVGRLGSCFFEETKRGSRKLIKHTDSAETTANHCPSEKTPAATRKFPMLPLHTGVSLNGSVATSSILVSDSPWYTIQLLGYLHFWNLTWFYKAASLGDCWPLMSSAPSFDMLTVFFFHSTANFHGRINPSLSWFTCFVYGL